MTEFPGTQIEGTPGGAHPISGGSTARTAFIGASSQGPLDAPILVYSVYEYGAVFGDANMAYPLGRAVHDYYLNGGQEAWIVRVANPQGGAIGYLQVADPALQAEHKGMYALEQAGGFNLLCIPPFDWEVDVDVQTWQAALGFCKRQRAMLLVDPPGSWSSAEQALAEVEGLALRDANTALYFPRLVPALRGAGGGSLPVAPGGAIAGVYARTDIQQGVWKSPAGREAVLNGVAGLAVELDEHSAEALNQVAINPLRSFAGQGCLIWGARTLLGTQAASTEWKYVPVRRLALYLEDSLANALQWTVFEPNAEPLWQRVRQVVGDFLEDLFQQGAFQGSTSAEAYFVRCGRDTITQADLEAGRLNVLVGVAPLRPAEFVPVKIGVRTRLRRRRLRKTSVSAL